MKNILSIISLMLLSSIVYSQGLESKEFKNAQAALIKQVDSLKKNKPLDEYNGSWIAKLEKEFYIDTFYIERLWGLEIDFNGSTLGMNQATYKAEKSYDKLLNKYYKKLLDRFQDEDKEKLISSQRNWIKFRDSEKEVNYALYDEQYSDGGTIHKIFVSNRSTEITKNRVIQLYHYLDRIWRPKKK